jgi:hypothetical protein
MLLRRLGTAAAQALFVDADSPPNRPDELEGLVPVVGPYEDARGVAVVPDYETARAVPDEAGSQGQAGIQDPLADAGLRTKRGPLADEQEPAGREGQDAADRRHDVGDILAVVQRSSEATPHAVTMSHRSWGRWVHRAKSAEWVRQNQLFLDIR